MLRNLMPKEAKYFENFNDMITLIKEMAHHTHTLFSSEIPDKNVMHLLKPTEVRCDEISAKIIKRLNTTFITPFDREDVFALVKKLNVIADMLLGAAVRVEILNITYRVKYADKLTYIIEQQINELHTAISNLKTKSVNEMKAVKALETEADIIYHKAIKELFENEADAIKIMKDKEVLDILENTSDKCQSAANVVMSIFIKNN
jgi:uncharacterized protein